MYNRCGDLKSARKVFDKMPQPVLVSWNSIIAACVRNGRNEEALELYGQMQELAVKPNHYTFGSVLKACTNLVALDRGLEIHKHIIEAGLELHVCVGTALIEFYAKCGRLEDANILFKKMTERNVVTWNTMISIYDQNGQGEEALELFCNMRLAGLKPDRFTFSTILTCCASLALPKHTKIVHANIIKTGAEDVFVGSALVDAYAKSQNVEDARRVFDSLSDRNVVSWGAIITGYTQSGLEGEALKLFCKMKRSDIKPDHFTFTSILSACASMVALKHGEAIHSLIIKTGFELDMFVGSALIDMYAKCKSTANAQLVFDKSPIRNIVMWSAMITGYAHFGHGEEALKLFSQMQLIGPEPDQFTFSSVLRACISLATLENGKQIHAYIIKTGFESWLFVGTNLVDMYAKCGSLLDSQDVFIECLNRMQSHGLQ